MFTLALILQDGPNPEAIRHMVLAMMAILPLIILIGLAIIVVPCWFICKKAGFSPWLSLLNLIPLGNLILLYVLAFSDWKVIPAPQALWQPQPLYPPPPTLPPQS
jgi:hypothetical protein